MKHRARHLNFESLESRRLLAAEPMITEFMASNRSSVVDDFGERADWIEIYNAGDAPSDLDGWYLTDDLERLDKWRFPAVSLGAGQYLLVHASGRDRIDPAAPLHTNFRLSAAGESLALVQPDGMTIASQVSAEFPRQLPDVAYGAAMEVSSTSLVDDRSHREVLVPTDNRQELSWTQSDFQPDERWLMVPGSNDGATSAVGYERGRVRPDTGEYATAVLSDRPVGYWRLEEVRGGVAENLGSLGMAADGRFPKDDQVRRGIDGVLPGAADHAASFRQVASPKIDVPHQRGLNPDNVTVEAWVRLDGGSGLSISAIVAWRFPSERIHSVREPQRFLGVLDRWRADDMEHRARTYRRFGRLDASRRNLRPPDTAAGVLRERRGSGAAHDDLSAEHHESAADWERRE